jgi:CTD small phosphatase-like protein 2
LFSPFYTLLVPGKTSSPGNTSLRSSLELRSSSEKNSPVAKNELSTDECISDISILNNETPEKLEYDLYDPYNNSVEEVEEEEEDCEEFDPYLFIANLPPITQIIPRQKAKLPPKGDTPKHTLVLDLDETLVHCSTEPLEHAELTFPVIYGGREYQVFVRKRPHFETFLQRVSKLFEVVVFTASQEVYASKLLDLIDPNGKYIHHRLYRDACVEVEGNYLKDLPC